MKKIVVPIDFSSATDCVLACAAEQARAFQAQLHLIHVREISALPIYPAATGYPGIGVPEMGMAGGLPLAATGLDPLPEAGHEPARKTRLQQIGEELRRDGASVVEHECDGAIVTEILRLAIDLPADLIVMGSHGHGSVYNLLVGSVTEGVLRARKCPLLLVPAPK